MTADHARSYLSGTFAVALAVRVLAAITDVDRDGVAWGIWRVLIVAALRTLAVTWAVLSFRERRQAAGGTTAMAAPWVAPLAGVAVVLALALLIGLWL
jgi:hypothetical protein